MKIKTPKRKSGKKMYVYCLEITSWNGLSIGATHYYGSIIFYDMNNKYNNIDVEGILTENQAKILTDKDWRESDGRYNYTYRAGEKTTRFETKDDVRVAAKKIFNDIAKGHSILVEGMSAAVDSKPIIDSTKKDIVGFIYHEHSRRITSPRKIK